MRYTIYDANDCKRGEASTAQGVADIATHATVSVDSNDHLAYPYTVYERHEGHIIGTMYATYSDAKTALDKMK